MWSSYAYYLRHYPLRTEMVTSAALWFMGDVLAQRLERLQRSRDVVAKSSGAKASKTDGGGDVGVDKNDGVGSGGRGPSREERKGLVTPPPPAASAAAAKKGNVDPPQSGDKMDWRRTAVHTIYSGIIWAPVGHHWYGFLDAIVRRAAASVSAGGAPLAESSPRLFITTAKLVLEMSILIPVSLVIFFVITGLADGKSVRSVRDQLKTEFYPTLRAEWALWLPLDLAMFAAVPVRHQLLVVNIGCLFESVLLSCVRSDGVDAAFRALGIRRKESKQCQ